MNAKIKLLRCKLGFLLSRFFIDYMVYYNYNITTTTTTITATNKIINTKMKSLLDVPKFELYKLFTYPSKRLNVSSTENVF